MAAKLRYSVQHNDWEVMLPPASTSRLQQQQQQGEGEWGQSAQAAPGPASEAGDEVVSWDSQDFADMEPEEDVGLACSAYAYYDYEVRAFQSSCSSCELCRLMHV